MAVQAVDGVVVGRVDGRVVRVQEVVLEAGDVVAGGDFAGTVTYQKVFKCSQIGISQNDVVTI